MVGGFDGSRHLSSVERFDTEQQTWECVAPIKIARSALSLTALDGKLFAMGGFDGQNFLTIVEVYCPEINAWDEGTPLTSGRSGHASAVIYQPSCVSTQNDCSELMPDGNKRNPRNDEDEDRDNQYNKFNLPTTKHCRLSSVFTAFSGNRCNNCGNSNNNKQVNNAIEQETSILHMQLLWSKRNGILSNCSNSYNLFNNNIKIKSNPKDIPDEIHSIMNNTEVCINDNPKKSKRKFCNSINHEHCHFNNIKLLVKENIIKFISIRQTLKNKCSAYNTLDNKAKISIFSKFRCKNN